MKIIALALAVLVSTPVLAQPTNLVPKRLNWNAVKAQLNGLTVSGCTLEQGAEISFVRSEGETVAVSKKTFDAVYRQSNRDLQTTLIALDAGGELCRVVKNR